MAEKKSQKKSSSTDTTTLATSACCPTARPEHLYYQVTPKNHAQVVIFIQTEPYIFWFHITSADKLIGLEEYLLSNGNMIFKIPKKFSATVHLTEVAIGAKDNERGRYVVDMQLQPAKKNFMEVPSRDEVTRLGAELKKRPIAAEEVGICSGSPTGPCPGTYSPCNIGEVLKKVEGVCKCVRGE